MTSAPPILGFGWRGMVAAAVLAALLSAFLAGVDLRYQLLALINSAIGWRGMYWFTIWFIAPNYLGSLIPTFGLIGMTYTLAAFHLAPLRHRALTYWAVVVWSLVCLPLWLLLASFAKASPAWLLAITPLGDYSVLVAIALELGTAVLLGVLTKSWRVAGAAVAALVIAWFVGTVVLAGRTWMGWPWHAVVYHAGLGAVLLTWAIRARAACFRPAHLCAGCGYDLRGLPSGLCPECGNAAATGPALGTLPEPNAGAM